MSTFALFSELIPNNLSAKLLTLSILSILYSGMKAGRTEPCLWHMYYVLLLSYGSILWLMWRVVGERSVGISAHSPICLHISHRIEILQGGPGRGVLESYDYMLCSNYYWSVFFSFNLDCKIIYLLIFLGHLVSSVLFWSVYLATSGQITTFWTNNCSDSYDVSQMLSYMKILLVSNKLFWFRNV